MIDVGAETKTLFGRLDEGDVQRFNQTLPAVIRDQKISEKPRITLLFNILQPSGD